MVKGRLSSTRQPGVRDIRQPSNDEAINRTHDDSVRKAAPNEDVALLPYRSL